LSNSPLTPALRAAAISPNADLIRLIEGAVRDNGRDLVDLAVRIPTSVEALDDHAVGQLRSPPIGLLFLDLGSAPDLAIRFAQYLGDLHPGQRIVAIGPALDPDLMMRAVRAGLVDFLATPVEAQPLEASLRRIVAQLTAPAGAGPRQPGKIFAFLGAKGGAGTTLVAANVAVALARQTGKKTLLVDLDLELGEAALALGSQARFNLIDLVENIHRMDAELLQSYMERHASGVEVLSAPFQPQKSEIVGPDQVRRILQFLRSHYDYVVVDTTNSFSPATIACLEQAGEVFLITTADLPSLRNVQRMLPMLRRVLPDAAAQLRLVVNRQSTTSEISVTDIGKALELAPYCALANDYEAVLQSLTQGKPVVLNPRSKFGRDIEQLATMLAGSAPGKGRVGALAGVVSSLRDLVRLPALRPAVTEEGA
jgi:pilus assembly protein CpaE